MFTNFPEVLRNQKQWVLWRREKKGEKWTKVPYQPSGAKAATTRPEEWSTFETCLAALPAYDGLGYVFHGGVVGLDLDHCLTPEGTVKPWAREILTRFPSYTEYSPSGDGLHILIQSDVELAGRKLAHVECYSGGRFFTVTGDVCEGRNTLRDCDVREWHHETFDPEEEAPAPPAPIRADLPDDETILRVMFSSKHGEKFKALFTTGDWKSQGYGSHSEADLAVTGYLMFFACNHEPTVDRLFRQSKLMRPKWDEKRGELTYGQRTMQEARKLETMTWEEQPPTPETPAKTPGPALPRSLTDRELRALSLPKPSWIVNRVIPAGGLVAISGRPGSYKSFFAIWLATRIAHGLPIFDLDPACPFFCEPYTAPGCVLFIEEENSTIVTRERVLGLKSAPTDLIRYRIDQSFKMQDPLWRQALLQEVTEFNIKLIIMDPFSSVMGLENENDNAEVSLVMDLIRKEFIARGVTILFIHHPAKGDDSGKTLRGAGDILGKCDVHLHLEKSETDKTLITVSYEKMRLIADNLVQNFKMAVVGDSGIGQMEFRYRGEAKPKHEVDREALAITILGVFLPGEDYSKNEQAVAVGKKIGDKAFEAAWSGLESNGKIRVSFTKRKGHNLYHLG